MTTELFMAIFGVILSFISGLALEECKKLGKKLDQQKSDLQRFSEANDKGTMALMRMRLVDAYDDYVIGHKKMSLERKQEIENLWEAYHDGMNGNGTATPLYEALHELKPYVVRGEWDSE